MTRLRRVLRIAPGEERTVGVMLGGLLLAWAGSSIGASAVESLLLSTVGPGVLPGLYVALGVSTSVVILALSRRLRGAVTGRTLLGSLAALAVVVAALRGLVQLPAPWVYSLAWLGMMIVWIASNLLWWGIAGFLHDTRQAKRLFPLYGAAVVLGVSAGGFLTAPLASWLGVANLLIVWAVASLLGCALVRRILPPGKQRSVRRGRRRPRPAPRGSIRRSPLLRWMWLSLATSGFLYFTLSLLFARGVARAFADAGEIAAFFGVFIGATSISALLVSLLVANRMFAAFGLATTILLLPLIYLTGFVAISLVPGFPVLAGFRFLQLVCVTGIWAAGWQALFNVVPGMRRDAVRSFLDATALQTGIVAAGAVALLAQRGVLAIDVRILGTAGAAIAALAGWRMRVAYRTALVQALREGDPEVFLPEQPAFGGMLRDRAEVEVARQGMLSEDPGVRRIAVSILVDAGDGEADVLRRAVLDADPYVRGTALTALAGLQDPAVTDLAEPLLDDPDAHVRAAALRVVASDGGVSAAEAAIGGALADTDPLVRSAAATALIGRGDRERGMGVIRQMALEEGVGSRVAAIDALSATEGTAEDPSLALDALRDPEPAVRDAAVSALVRAGGAAIAPLEALLRDDVPAAAACLARLRPGHPDVNAFVQGRLSLATRYLGFAGTLDALDEGPSGLLAHSLRYAALDALVAGVDAATMTPTEGTAIRLALEGIHSEDAAQRANALEALESMGGDLASIRSFVAGWEGVAGEDTGRDGAFAELADDPDPWIRECARYARTRQDDGVDRPARLSVIDRMVFLRNVPLFARLAPADLKHVAEAVSERAFADGDVIAEEGEPGDELHLVVDGEIRVLIGAESEVARRRAGEYVGEMAVISREPRMAALVCAGAVRTLCLDRPRFERILRERPEVAIAAMRVLSERLREAHSPATGNATS